MFQHADAAGFPRGQFFLPDIPEVIVSSELRASRAIYPTLEMCAFCWKAKESYRNAKERQKDLSPSWAALPQETVVCRRPGGLWPLRSPPRRVTSVLLRETPTLLLAPSLPATLLGFQLSRLPNRDLISERR